MSETRANWRSSRGYRTFVDRAAPKATIVGNQVVDDATGTSFGRVLVVADTSGYVCDLEIELDQDPTLSTPSRLDDIEEKDDIRTTIAPASAQAALIESWLVLSFSADDGGRWIRLSASGLYLRVDGTRLLGVAVKGPEDDPAGRKEAAWLSSLTSSTNE
jgi:hypothetical protein